MQSVIIKIRESELEEPGRWLLDTIRHQDRHLAIILQPRNGIIYAEINDEDTDDILRVWVDDTLGHAERVRRFGGGNTTQTPEQQEHAFGLHAMSAAARRLWWVPEPLIAHARRNPDQGAAIINAAGEALRGWCAEGSFVVWRDPDWMSQSEAAEFVGISPHAIRNAVRDGRLATWEDPDEPNPQRRTRVRRSEVQQRWRMFPHDDKQKE